MKQTRLLTLGLMLFACNSLQAAQIIEPASNEYIIVSPGGTAIISPYYRVSLPQDSTESGVSIRVHYNSQALTFSQMSNAVSNNIRLPDGSTMTDLQPISDPQLDTQNYDGDTNTDRYFIVSWVDPNINWPQRNLPAKLFDTYFIASNTYSGNTMVHFTATATSAAAGNLANFQSTPVTICIDKDDICSQLACDVTDQFMSTNSDGDITPEDAFAIYDMVQGNRAEHPNAAPCDGDPELGPEDAFIAYWIAMGMLN